MTLRFARKNALVTGAASGIGRATTLLLAREGANVVAMDIHDTVQELPAGGGSIFPLLGDAGREDDVREAITEAVRRFGSLDILCANAGISGGPAGLFDQSVNDWESILRVNVLGAFLAIKHGAQAMLDQERPGAIICTASIAGLRAGAGGPAYSASKAAVINLVQTAAQQLSGSGIRVNAVCPGLIETAMTQPIFDGARAKGREALLGQLNPLKRGGQAQEVAEAIAFLASADASYVNGHALVADGGLSTSHPFAKPQTLGSTTF